ncbi:periplasmic substrate-binding histidine kinase [Citrifermentans bemidjiense Bem]|uniref:histidine kinase n=1 Tax=Citrifermentans bemidjiense (strain ATCC BAA-1014 / DSM 16622 / JCM 12645 / Bem) TaxID=404380 RepID=B5E9Q3_CITBB|nr:transporter substrate-binding domain-containing protein [Citrifermentans bemidjiense]ACH40227.1 periplasmic substrate-binding histidine kinase [Citrifermentans bemidjiense Bem]
MSHCVFTDTPKPASRFRFFPPFSTNPSPAAGNRALFSLLLLVLLLSLAPLAQAQQSAPVHYDPAATIVVGGDRSYPPYEFIDKDGRPAGYNVDLTKAIAEVMGMKVEFRFGSWAEMRAGLQQGKINILQGLSYSDERSRSVDFSPPHAMVHHAIFARRDSKRVRTLEELKGKKVIVFQDGIMHERLKLLGFGKDLVLTPTPAEALRLLASGQYDYAVVAQLPGMYLIRELHLTNLVPVAKAVVSEQYGYGVAKGNKELLTRFNEGLAIVIKTGQYAQIYNRWLGVHEPPRVTREMALKYGAMILVPLLLVLAGTALWNKTLHKRVVERTTELAQEVSERNKALEALRRHQDKLIQADKMASLGTLVSGVAHEINNPNGLLLLDIPILRRVHEDAEEILEARYLQEGDFMLGGVPYSEMREEIPRILEEMQDGAQRIKRIVNDLKDFARRDDAGYMEPIDVEAAAKRAVRLVEPTIRSATNRFEALYAGNLPPVLGNAQRIEQVIVNLVLNACQSLPGRDQGVTLTTSLDSESDSVLIEVRDEGVGIAQEHLPQLVDPFFTTKRETGGTGLGLSVSAGIVKEHGGTLCFASTPGEGTTVTLSLPVTSRRS